MVEIGFGIFCSNSEGSLSTNHTFRISNLSFKKVFEAFNYNLNDLFNLLALCRSVNVVVFRLGSNFIPFASHKLFKDKWLNRIEPLIRDAGKKIKEQFNIRITMHPGQFVILNSPQINVIERSLRELQYHFWVLDNLGIGEDGIVIIHVGGAYSDRERAIDRFIETVEKNNWLKKRLALENDERLFNARDVLKITKILKIPFVFDYFHHIVNPSEVSFDEIFDTWQGRGIPKMHLSSKGSGRIGIHGDYIDLRDFLELKKMLDKSGIEKAHIMIEAKKKEKALKKLREKLTYYFTLRQK